MDSTLRYYRKIIRIRAEDSPNVRYGLAYLECHGASNKTSQFLVHHGQLIPGVKSTAEYLKDRALLPKGLQDIVLDARFPQGADDFMYPVEWIDAAEKLPRPSKAMTIGVDPAAGGDDSTWALVCSEGLVDLVSRKTPDTARVGDQTIFLMDKHGVDAKNVWFDDGGGGKQHADYLRRKGYEVQTVAFGEAVTPLAERRGKIISKSERVRRKEERYAYRNRRAQLFHLLRLRLDPSEGGKFALPRDLLDRKRGDGGPSLREQMRPIPIWYDDGRICLPRKNRRPGSKDRPNEVTLEKLIGCSPDQLEAVLLGVFGLERKRPKSTGFAIY